MKKITKFAFIAAVAIATSITSCTKDPVAGPQGDKGEKGDKGDMGLQGIAGTNGTNGVDGTNGTNGTNGAQGIQGATGNTGATGQTGAQGATGQTGATGAQGNANVKSNLATTTASNWTYDGNNKSWFTVFIDNNITQAIVDNGAVMVYVLVGTNQYAALPFTFHPTANYSTSVVYSFAPQQLRVEFQDSDLTQGNNPGDNTFKIVKVAGAFIKAHPQDWQVLVKEME